MKGRKIFSSLLAIAMLFTMLSTTAFAVDKTITVAEDGKGDYYTIQAAIDYIAEQDDATGWTIEVKNGTYDRFTVPHYASSGISDLTIIGYSEDGVIINVLDGSSREDILIDHGGINIYGMNVTLQNMTISAGTDKQSWDDAAISTHHGKSGGANVSLTVENCTLVGPGIGNGATYGIFWACSGMNVIGCNISGFANAIEYMNDGFNVPYGETYYLTNNVITGSSFAIHGYMGGGSGGGTLKITGNVVTGTDNLRSKVICQDNVSDSFVVDICDNTLTNAIVGLVNLQDEGDVLYDVLDNNTFGNNSFYVEAIEPGTIEFYATYQAPEDAEGYWALTGIDDFDVDWGKNPDGSTAYIEDIVAKANAEGSHTLSITGIDENNLIKTFTWFKDGIYWIGENDKTSYPGLEKWINVGDTDGDGTDNWVKDDTVAAGDTIDFVLVSNVPEDLMNYLEPDEVERPQIYGFSSDLNSGEYWLAFHDTMDSNLTLVEDSVQVTIGGNIIDSAYYDVIIPSECDNGCTFDVVMDLVALYNDGCFTEDDFGTASIVVTYSATASRTLAPGEYLNQAWVEYEGGETTEDTVTVETFGIEIFKYDQVTGEGLYDAAFELYTAVKNGDGGFIKGDLIATVNSGGDGYADIDGLDAGRYLLYETAAPGGYVKSDEPVLIVIPDDADEETNIVDVKFANAEIPHTGGTGTVMYTVGGAAVIVVAAVLFVVSRKKKVNE